ncbi:MAG: hypothetical protein ACLT98_09635 [Eggerthellaceae bacterium]
MASTNASDVYFGAYVRFQTVDKRSGAAIAGPDNAVGDCGEIVWQLDEKKRQQAWLKNRFGQLVGYLDHADSYKLAIYRAKGWTIRYVLSFTAYSETPGPASTGAGGRHRHAPRYADEFDAFVRALPARRRTGRARSRSRRRRRCKRSGRPDGWEPSNKVKIPKGSGRTVILKERRSAHDKLLDKGRSGNIGCYIVSWAFILGLVAFAVWAAHSMGLF